jgi:hypothetical protein
VKALRLKAPYVVDGRLRQEGFEVIRLPPYYCIYNPIGTRLETSYLKVKK